MQETIDSPSNRVVAVAGNFPTPKFPERGVFVRNIVLEMARQGAEVDVIAPDSRVTALKTWRNPPQDVDSPLLNVTRPKTSTIPLRFAWGFRRAAVRFNDATAERAIERALPPGAHYDVCYAHFFPAGRAALRPMTERGIPVFLNMGESSPWIYDELYGPDEWIKDLSRFAGIVTVSESNRRYLMERDPGLDSRVRYIPNGVDTERFQPQARKECRAKLGLPPDETIAIFCGHFIRRKGPLRVLEALRHAGIKGIFLGAGPDHPRGSEVLFAGSVVNDDVSMWLNAADVFVLPSLAEGMSNAILEALACGLPVVVSDRDFNREFIAGECAEFVDPTDAVDIARGISRCLERAAGDRLREASVALARQYGIEKRVRLITEFMRGESSARPIAPPGHAGHVESKRGFS